MLVQRRRRWDDAVQMLYKYLCLRGSEAVENVFSYSLKYWIKHADCLFSFHLPSLPWIYWWDQWSLPNTLNNIGSLKRTLQYHYQACRWILSFRARILVKVTIYRRLLIGRDGHLSRRTDITPRFSQCIVLAGKHVLRRKMLSPCLIEDNDNWHRFSARATQA